MRVLVVDDHPLYRQGVKALLMQLDPEVEVLEAGTVAQCLAMSGDEPGPQLVLLDMYLPDCDPGEVVRRVKVGFDGVPVVVVSGDEDPQLVRSAIDAGASGYVPKSTDPSLTVSALRLVLAHGVYLPIGVMERESSGQSSTRPRFSDRQREVLDGLLHGKSNKLIARELGIAEGTVKAHLWAIFQVLGVATRTAAMARAVELDLLPGRARTTYPGRR
jgi:DNA-binding NarL/FixJ family response regulator